MAAEITEAPAQLKFHSARARLIDEAHARPSTPLRPPLTLTRVATLSGSGAEAGDRVHMARLCEVYGAPVPDEAARWHAVDNGGWQLRWERHTEFSTWTFSCPADREPFARNAMTLAPADWISALPGDVLVATMVDLRAQSDEPPERVIPGAVGSFVRDAAASVHSEFRPDRDGFTRFLALANSDDAVVLGRIVLALLEIETYRLMALLAFPMAVESGAEISHLEAEAGELALSLGADSDVPSDHDLLEQLAQLAAHAESLRARISFRFGAARAYHKLVGDRIEGLSEQPIQGAQTLAEFMHRRLAPAMRTCDSTAERLNDVVERIARTEQLLNTRVEVAAEATSLALLASMDARAEAQLKLQRTVEGLSVAAISYYAMGLILFMLEAARVRFPGIEPKVAAGLMTVPVVLTVWLILRRLRSKLAA